MEHLGARLVHIAPGVVHIAVDEARFLGQQNGFIHAGVTTSIGDSAGGYAAMTLFPPGAGVLTTELKINLLRPAQGRSLIARAHVVKPGAALTVCTSDVFGIAKDGTETHVATSLMTCMKMINQS